VTAATLLDGDHPPNDHTSLERVEGTPRKLRRFKIWPETS